MGITSLNERFTVGIEQGRLVTNSSNNKWSNDVKLTTIIETSVMAAEYCRIYLERVVVVTKTSKWEIQ